MSNNTQRITTTLVWITALTLLAGCSGARVFLAADGRLATVNANLQGRSAHLFTLDGSELKDLYHVQVTVDSVYYRQESVPHSLATSDVDRILATKNSGGAVMAAILPLPGLVALSGSSSLGDFCNGFQMATFGFFGGAILGGLLFPMSEQIVYQGPIENYLP